MGLIQSRNEIIIQDELKGIGQTELRIFTVKWDLRGCPIP